MPKGKKRRKKKNIRRAAVNKRTLPDKFHVSQNMVFGAYIMLKDNGIKKLSVRKLMRGIYDFTFNPDKDYSSNDDVMLACEVIQSYMTRKNLESIDVDVTGLI